MKKHHLEHHQLQNRGNLLQNQSLYKLYKLDKHHSVNKHQSLNKHQFFKPQPLAIQKYQIHSIIPKISTDLLQWVNKLSKMHKPMHNWTMILRLFLKRVEI